jgi:hypothetical protein
VGENPGNDVLDQWYQSFGQQHNLVSNPGIWENEGVYKLFPDSSEDVYIPEDSWFDAVNYRGAFKDYNWTSGWSLLDKEEIILN